MDEKKLTGGAHYRRATGRVGVVLQPTVGERDLIRAAAALVGERMAGLVLAAGLERARKILADKGIDPAKIGPTKKSGKKSAD